MKSRILEIQDARIIICENTENTEELKSQIKLSEKEENELLSISSEKRKLEFLGVRLAVKLLLNTDTEISYHHNGKPLLADNSYHISISHSKKWIAVIVSKNRLVGIDIETPNDKIARISEKFMGAEELKNFSTKADKRILHIIWSAKEVLYKIIGNQAVDFSKQLQIFPFEPKDDGTLNAKHIPTNTLFQLQYMQSPEYTLVYCLA